MVFAPPPPKEATERMGFRLPESLAKYIIDRSSKVGGKPADGELTRVAIEAIALHKALYERLAPHEAELKRLAAAEGLEWPRQFNELLLRIVERSVSKRK